LDFKEDCTDREGIHLIGGISSQWRFV